MILGYSEVLRLVGESRLVENFSLDCLGGAGYDLRVGRVYSIRSDSFLGVGGRRTPDVVEREAGEFKLTPGEYVLVESLEKVNMPSDLAARILPRSSVFRCGCMLATAVVDPGFSGTLTMGLKNVSERDFVFEVGARVAQIVFERVEGETRGYEGRYQGGRVV